MSDEPQVIWSSEDDDMASKEGWSIFQADAGESRVWMQLQRVDDAEVFPDDRAAWGHVRRKAEQGSELHKRALAYLKQVNPAEYAEITGTPAPTPRPVTPSLPRHLDQAHDLIIRMVEEQNRHRQRIAELEKAILEAMGRAVARGEEDSK